MIGIFGPPPPPPPPPLPPFMPPFTPPVNLPLPPGGKYGARAPTRAPLGEGVWLPELGPELGPGDGSATVGQPPPTPAPTPPPQPQPRRSFMSLIITWFPVHMRGIGRFKSSGGGMHARVVRKWPRMPSPARHRPAHHRSGTACSWILKRVHANDAYKHTAKRSGCAAPFTAMSATASRWRAISALRRAT